MNLNDPTSGRILLRGAGHGDISAADIERRARELADIDGRSGADITPRDLARARSELLGHHLPPTTMEDDASTAAISRDPSEPPSARGREAPPREAADEEKAIERLALEGVEEAQHEQMIAARRRDRRLDETGQA